MGAVEIVSAATALINLANKAVEAANNGDEAAALKYLEDARDHFSISLAAWDAAGKS
jgi:hypothetical protein